MMVGAAGFEPVTERHGGVSAVEAQRRAKKLLGVVASEADPYRNHRESTFEVIVEEYIKRRFSCGISLFP